MSELFTPTNQVIGCSGSLEENDLIFFKAILTLKLSSIYELVSSQNDMISVVDVDKRGEQNIV